MIPTSPSPIGRALRLFTAGCLLAAAPAAGLAQTLAGLWRFDNPGSAQADSSSNANTAVTGGNATYLFDATRASGVMSFDGANDYLTVAHSVSLSITGDITLAAWVNVGATIGGSNNWRGVFSKDTNGGNPSPYQFWFNANNLAPVLGRGDGNAQAYAQPGAGTVPTENSWEHWAVTMSGANVTFYRDGSAFFTGSLTTTTGDAGNPLYIGNRPDLALDFLGRMDDVAIFSGALDSTQINAIKGGDFSAFGVAVPEPSTHAALAGAGALALALWRRRKTRAAS